MITWCAALGQAALALIPALVNALIEWFTGKKPEEPFELEPEVPEQTAEETDDLIKKLEAAGFQVHGSVDDLISRVRTLD